ncbi:hypothetical protein [Psychrobacter immobilis]|uniref:hypothetical protein n=1 Tax=Psychrobacter immobilis TaxID=498 RepID=UPI001919A109|nr:hypothetical protein [Psychrobacter immobilis]
MSRIIKFEMAETSSILDKLVPPDSPSYLAVQRLIIDVIEFLPDYGMTVNSDLSVDSDVLILNNCQSIAEQVVKESQTDVWATTYMLVLFYQVYGNPCANNNAWRFISGYLQVMFIITSRNDKHFARINQLSVRVRMGLKPNNPQTEILEKLIDIHEQHDSLIQVLTNLLKYENTIKNGETSGKLKNRKLASKIGQIRLAYEVVAEDKAFVSKRYSKNTEKCTNENYSNKTYIDSDDEPLRAILFSTKQKDNNVADAENIADDDVLQLLDNNFKPAKNVAKSSELQQWKLRSSYMHTRRHQFRFPTNTRQLSIIGYQMLFAELWQQFLTVSYKERHVHAVILLSLLSGRKIQNIIEELQLEKSQRNWLNYESSDDASEYCISNTIDVTSNRRSYLLEHRQSYGSEFKLPLPTQLQAVIENKLSISSDKIAELLVSIKNQLGMPALTSQHIESGLFIIIKNEINEPLHADMITGVDVRHSSALYYTSIETNNIRKTYKKALHLLSHYCDRESQKQLRHVYQAWMDNHHYKPYIGSDMTLKNTVCIQFFNQLAHGVESFNGCLKRDSSKHYDRYIEQFNAYGVWLWHVIMIQTGIRPVKHAPGLLCQFDFNHRTFWVSDKEERSGQSDGRIIPLSSFLIESLQNYLVYINRFAAIHNVIYSNETFPIHDILNSNQPLIQIYSRNPKGFSGITASSIRYQLKDFFSHQDNWLRHQLRSMLTDKVPEHLICTLYGHEHPDQETMHPMSSTYINQIKSLSNDLDQVADELELKQVEVSLHA